MFVAAWVKCAMWEDGTSPACCGFSLLHGCCWGRSRRVQPEVCLKAAEMQDRKKRNYLFSFFHPPTSKSYSDYLSFYFENCLGVAQSLLCVMSCVHKLSRFVSFGCHGESHCICIFLPMLLIATALSPGQPNARNI